MRLVASTLRWRTFGFCRALDAGAAERLQSLFPEGYVFTWALFGLAAAQLLQALPASEERRRELIEAARAAVEHVGSTRARSTFDEGLDPPYGAFYASWFLYLRSTPARGREGSDAGQRHRFHDCDRFALAIDRSDSPFLPSYQGGTWPADTAVGVAALVVHDAVLEPRNGEVTAAWVRKARARLDPELGLLPHAADGSGNSRGVRGSSLALMSRVLVHVDAAFAREQYEGLRRTFLAYRWGVPGVLEYPAGAAADADIDSGPLVLGFSGPATVVGAAPALAHGDLGTARVLLGVAEVAGLPVEFGGERRYVAGPVPVGEPLLAWARSTPVIDAQARFKRAFPAAWAWGPSRTLSRDLNTSRVVGASPKQAPESARRVMPPRES
jgi:hypothetical protein